MRARSRRISRMRRLGDMRLWITDDQRILDRFVQNQKEHIVEAEALRQIEPGNFSIVGNRATVLARGKNGIKKTLIFWKRPPGERGASVQRSNAISHELFHAFQRFFLEKQGFRLNIQSALGSISEELFVFPHSLYTYRLGKKRKNSIRYYARPEEIADMAKWRNIHEIRQFFPRNEDLYEAITALVQDPEMRPILERLNQLPKIEEEIPAGIEPYFKRIVQYLIAYSHRKRSA